MKWFTNLFSRRRTYTDLSGDIQSHLEEKIEELIAAGMSRKEAAATARREFGNVTQLEERGREVWRWPSIEDFFQDVRYGLRLLRKNPGFTAIAVLTLALGIGANTAIFSLIDTVMLRMLPVQHPEELVSLATRHQTSSGEPDSSFSYLVWQQIRDRQNVLSGTFAFAPTAFDLAQGGASQNANGLFVSGDFFGTLGVHPAAGRLLGPTDDTRGCAGNAVLSYDFWQEHYAGAQSAVGGTISLNRHSIQIVGVAPPGFFGVTVGTHFDVAIPICAEAIISLSGEPDGQKFLDRPSAQWLGIMGRTKQGISIAKLNAGLKVLSPGIFAATVSPEWKAEWQKDFLSGTLLATPAGGGVSDLQDYSRPLKMLMALVGLVLLIACANIASLMLARATARRKEIAVRMAMGASRSRLIRQLLTECILLSSSGALVGLFLAWWGCALLVRFISTSQFHVFLQLSLDARILAFTAAAAMLTGLLFGLLPALRSTRVSLTSAMKGGQSVDASSRSHFRPGRWVVASQVALSLVLLVVAGLFLRSFNNLITLNLGFDRTNVLLIGTNDQNAKLSRDQRAVLYRQVLDKLKTLPGAASVSESFVTPISGYMWGLDYQLEKGGGPTGDDANAYMNFVSPGFFDTFRTPLIAGRDFNEHDIAGAPPVVIINESMSRRFFHGAQPIGQYLVTDDFLNDQLKRKGPPLQIVGVLKDTKYQSLREHTASIVYFPVAQAEVLDDPRNFEIRTTSNPLVLTRPAETAIAGLNNGISLNFQTLESQVNDSLRPDHLLAVLSGFFGGLALLLAMIGLYGVLSYMVTQRQKEIGIRVALGAGRGSILTLVLKDVSSILLAGIAVGLGISWWAVQLVRTMLFNLNVHDTGTMALAIAALAGVALFAGYIPARRATKVHPMEALRND